MSQSQSLTASRAKQNSTHAEQKNNHNNFSFRSDYSHVEVKHLRLLSCTQNNNFSHILSRNWLVSTFSRGSIHLTGVVDRDADGAAWSVSRSDLDGALKRAVGVLTEETSDFQVWEKQSLQSLLLYFCWLANFIVYFSRLFLAARLRFPEALELHMSGSTSVSTKFSLHVHSRVRKDVLTLVSCVGGEKSLRQPKSKKQPVSGGRMCEIACLWFISPLFHRLQPCGRHNYSKPRQTHSAWKA